jgi:hypothetical protein
LILAPTEVLCLAMLFSLLLLPTLSPAFEPVRAEIGKETAWTGEAIPLIITLYSPGPFSGTAAFDLPEIPRTAFVKTGSPLVGSEQVDDETYMTQRHEFRLFTQQAGEIVVPAFRVRFSGKKTFTSDPEPMEGFTPELRFQSRRPPGTEKLGTVVAATEMEVSQSWKPEAIDVISAGDVIERTIRRRATGTTAMMLPLVTSDAPESVRVYMADPIVQDQTQRGESTAERSDTFKYQFERAGTFQLPDVSLSWWDVQASELKQQTLPGETVEVEGTVSTSEAKPKEPEPQWPPTAWLLTIGLAVLLVMMPASRCVAAWRARRSNPEAVAARRLLAACRRDAPADAYAALLQWKRSVCRDESDNCLDRRLKADNANDLQRELAALAQRIFGVESSQSPWSGRPLAEVFARVRRQLGKTTQEHRASSSLPALNPTDPFPG